MSRNKMSDILESRILELLHQGLSQQQTAKVLKSGGINVAPSIISHVKRKIGRQCNFISKIQIQIKNTFAVCR